MAKSSGIMEVELIAQKCQNLDTVCYRGSAPLAHLALISQADVFDQVKNAEGLQRDLSPKHASDAYEYVHREKLAAFPRAFPEVVLNVRDKKVLELADVGSGDTVSLRFSLTKMHSDKVYVSRVDGNHRLFYAEGDERREPLLVQAPFQIHVGLTRDQERSLFVDINSNQKGLNSSHLSVMQSRLSEDEQEIKYHLDRWIANRLVNDSESPWHGQVHMGGSKAGARAQGLVRPVNFASLQAGASRLLGKSHYIHDLTDPEAQYRIIRNYWQAVRSVFAQEWAQPRQYLLLRNMGVWVLSVLGGTIIDRCIPRSKVGIEDMARYLRQVKGRFDWDKDSTGDKSLNGMSGNRAAMIIAGEMAAELSDETGENIMKRLQDELLKS